MPAACMLHPYRRDADYLGALTMWDAQLGRLLRLLHERGVAHDTALFFTSDNGPHQGASGPSDVRMSTHFLRQCMGDAKEP